MSASRPLVLDSWAVLAHFQGESAGESVAELVAQTLERGRVVAMSVVNACEVWYTAARAGTPAEADDVILELRRWGVEIIDADWPLTREAALLKSRYRISLADAFALALAKHHRAELVTGDPEFKAEEGEIRIAWLK